MSVAHPVIAWDYQFAPNPQNARNLLHATNIQYSQCLQPWTHLRPVLLNLGITYRRSPVLSIGKDVYCDNSVFLDAVQTLSVFTGHDALRVPLRTSPADKAYEAFGYSIFWIEITLALPELITSDLAKDREHIAPVYSRPDFVSLRPNALSEWRAVLETIEHDFLTDDGPFIGGHQECGIADIHVMWPVKHSLQTLEVASELGFGRVKFPRVWKWIESLPPHDESTVPTQLSAQDATQMILAAGYAATDIAVDPSDPLALSEGTRVSVEASDVTPGTNLQFGMLVGLGKKAIVLQLENGLRLHFPRVGYLVREV